jgi:hypothetical protein
MSGIDSPEFRVEVWDAGDNRREELVALCSNSLIAKGAYDAALKITPGANLLLRHRSRIISRGRGVRSSSSQVLDS